MKFSEPRLTTAQYTRLGGLMHDGEIKRSMHWSRAEQISATWRSHLAWRLANALGCSDRTDGGAG